MKAFELIQIVVYLLLLTALTPLLGGYMAKVFTGEKNVLTCVFGKTERALYRMLSINANEGMGWKTYLYSLLFFNLLGSLVLLILQLFQNRLPLNPEHLPSVPFHLAFNAAVSFMTNTNWQSYAGETTLSYLVQMAGMTVQNFLSAATGIAVMLALTRSFIKRCGRELGNFWVDMVRSVLYVLLPLSFVLALVLVSQGVVQTFSPYEKVKTLQGIEQIIPLGPAASQIAIKQLGTNGGGFFNANSAFPFENPTPLTDFLEMLSILLVPAALTYTYGKMIGSTKQGWTIFSAMMVLFLAGLVVSLISEYRINPLTGLVNMEGKETRFGIANSVLWSTATTSASNGSINAMIDSMNPLTGFIAMLNIKLGEIIFGGVGSGMYGILIFVLLTVFIAGLMVGRTPEYLGKKIEALEVKMSILAVLLPGAVILLFSSISSVIPAGLSSLKNAGPHGLSEILYAFDSAAGNNGSAFAGLNADTVYYNLILALTMLVGRFGVIIPVMVIAGSLIKKNIAPLTAGTFITDTPLFAVLLISVIIIIGALTFFPVLCLGPIAEHLLMQTGITF
jgi:K+-transporting ATPase ATPase A chain